MTPERWQQIEDILDEVMPLDTEERAARIGRLCHGDTALYSEVEEMMGFCDQVQAESFLEAPPHLAAQDLLMGSMLVEPQDEHLKAGTAIGPYTIIEQVGRGGMGEVYLAERADPHMRVALKVVKRGMDTNEILQRFRYEREILARLNHPNIAQLYGGGVTEDGRPYFAMEYVQGKTLEAYCDDKHLSIAQRLALFKTVCEAVRYAHRNLVVHRDLKPGNILVSEGEAGQPLVKLLDFGIAKLIEEDASLHTIPMTQAGALRMTPGYAAPEQVRGQHTTPATDVYALGVILYRLLTGRRPYYFEDRSVTGIESVICLQMPDRPSTVVVRSVQSSGDGAAEATPEDVSQQRATSPKMLRRQLSGDLDAITLMALRKESERRYASAAEFLDDIERYLGNRPVVAQHDSVAYRTAKFAQRHTAGVGITAAMVLLITALVTFYTMQLTQERDRAEQSAARAISTRDFMVGTFELADPEAVPDPQAALDETFSKRELIKSNLTRIDELSNPLDRAAVLDVMGQVSISYGLFDQADTLYRSALAIKIDELGTHNPDLAETLYGLGQVAYNRFEYEAADSLYLWALDVLDQANRDKRRLIPRIQNTLAFVLDQQRRYEEAHDWYLKALAEEDNLLQENPAETEIQLLKTRSLWGLATLRHKQGFLEDAEHRYRQALDVLDEAGQTHSEYANTLFSLAGLLRERGDVAEAETHYFKAFDLYSTIYDEQHITVGNSLFGLAYLYQETGKTEKAQTYYRRSYEVYKAVLPPDNPRISLPLIALGRLHFDRNECMLAEPLLRESLDILQVRNLPTQASRIAKAKYRLGACWVASGKYQQAEPFILASYSYFKEQSALRNWQSKALHSLVELYDAWQQPGKVAQYQALLEALPSAEDVSE